MGARSATHAAALAHRLIAGALMLVIALAPLGAVLHFALVEHHFCAEHGAVEHDASEAPHASHPTKGSQPPIPDGDEPSESHHDSCSFPVALPAGTDPAPEPAVAIATAAALAAVARCREPSVPAIPLLLLAPKTSPPLSS